MKRLRGLFAGEGPLGRAPWLLAACLVPFFLLAPFTHPAADDFVYAAWAQDLGFVGVQKFWYLSWCGRYTATLLQTGFPLALDMTRAYPLVPLVLLAGWVASLAAFLAALEGLLPQGRLDAAGCRRPIWVLTAALAALYVTQMPSVCEGFYWLAGGATYQLAAELTLLVLALAFSARRGASGRVLTLKASAAALLALAAAGCNETMLPLVNLILLVGTGVAWRARHPARWVWTAALAAYFLGSLAVVLSPGNALRSAHFAGKPPLATCLAKCAWDTIRHVLKWSIRPMLLGLSIMGIPLAVDLVKRAPWAERMAIRHVLLLAAATLGAVLLSFAPAYLSIGGNPPARAENVSYCFFLAGWFSTWLVAVARFRNVRGREPRLSPRTLALGRAALVVGVLAIGSFPRAVYDLVVLAPGYDREVRQRYALLHENAAAGQAEVVLQRLAARPKSICFGDVGDEPSQNALIARYFGVCSVAVGEAGTRR